jgi:hypothetical protein
LAVLFAGGVVGGVLSDHVRGGTVAWAQEDQKPLQIDALTVKKLTVLESVVVQGDESGVLITPKLLGISTGDPTGPVLSLGADGLGILSGPWRVSVRADAEGARLQLGNGDKLQCSLSSSDRSSILCLRSPETEEEVWLSLFRASGPHVALRDRAGNSRVTLGPNDDGRWEVGVWNADGRGRTLTADR